jgi:hypothetical protein
VKRLSDSWQQAASIRVLPVLGDGNHLVSLSYCDYIDAAKLFAKSKPNGDYRIDILAAS